MSYAPRRKTPGGLDDRKARATIKDVAELAGVSPTTVSHALNGKGRVDSKTRDRILAAADQLKYRVNRTARALRSQRTGVIAFATRPFERGTDPARVLTPHIYMDQAMAASELAFQRGYSLLLTPPIAPDGAQATLDVDGAILCDPIRNDPLYELFERHDVPIVTIERHPGRPGNPWHVRADNERDAWALLEHFADQGATRCAMLRLDAPMAWSLENTATYRRWCRERGQDPIVAAVDPGHLETSAYKTAARLLDGPDRPDAIFASAERFASGVVRAARERNVRIPEDLLVATAIDGPEVPEMILGVTAIDVDPWLQGETAAELLIDRIEGRPTEAPRITPSTIRLRESTTRPRN